MAQRRPITSHPAFAPLVALWFAALLGLGVAVLPTRLLERTFAAMDVAALVPLTLTGRLAASAVAALFGALLGLLVAIPLARRGARDPRPIYAEGEAEAEDEIRAEPVRRPLSVREEFEDLADGAVEAGYRVDTADPDPLRTPASRVPPVQMESDEGFMILSPRPIHPPRPAPDLQALLDQFDNALVAFREGEEAVQADASSSRAASPAREPIADPVHAFVARQTAAAAPSPLGGLMPDHQAELRAALDKLARAHRKD